MEPETPRDRNSEMPAGPEPVRKGIRWVDMLKIIVPGAILVAAAGGACYAIARSARMMPILGMMELAIPDWQEDPGDLPGNAPQEGSDNGIAD